LLQETKTGTLSDSREEEGPSGMGDGIFGANVGPIAHISTTVSRTGVLAIEMSRRQQFAKRFREFRKGKSSQGEPS
jgi:hypothetical protein